MSTQYKNNHYVPIWYQKRFLPNGRKEQELYYRDLKPEVYFDSKGKTHLGKIVYRRGFKKCFALDDLYTAKLGAFKSTKIEEIFFGQIDRRASMAVDYFANFTHPSINKEAFNALLMHMSTQKLRTPKGLGLLSQKADTTDQNLILQLMLKLRSLYCAIWTECVWLIADAAQTSTKFIISDHPVTVYNRKCGPFSQRCHGYNDPEIWLQGTHTIFPLSLDKVLILTNLSWVRNPYQLETKSRPNPNPLRNAIFKFWDVQTTRHLNEQEVQEINFIIKSRADRYIAAAQEDWLFPEKHISKSQWNIYGDGYLLMPDPRSVSTGGEIIWGNYDGTGGAMDEYGRPPWQSDYSKESSDGTEFNSLHRFQGEFARLYGPYRRGRSFQFGQLDLENDSDKLHQYHLGLEKSRGRRRPHK